MIHPPNLTSAGLLDHVGALLCRTLPGRVELGMRAYLADRAGAVAVIDIAPPSGAAEHGAVGALIGAEMRSRASRIAVVQIAWLREQDRSQEPAEVLGLYCIGSNGRQRGHRLLRVERGPEGQVVRLTPFASGGVQHGARRRFDGRAATGSPGCRARRCAASAAPPRHG